MRPTDQGGVQPGRQAWAWLVGCLLVHKVTAHCALCDWSIATARLQVRQKSDALRTQQIHDSSDNQVIILGTKCILQRLNQRIEGRGVCGAMLSAATRGKDGFHTLPPVSWKHIDLAQECKSSCRAAL